MERHIAELQADPVDMTGDHSVVFTFHAMIYLQTESITVPRVTRLTHR